MVPFLRLLVGLVVLGSAGLLGVILALAVPSPYAVPTQFGVSFSAAQATGTGLNWREVYQAILYDLGVRRLRLGAYWDEIEPAPGAFDFAALDYQIDEAAKAGASVVVTVGRKVQRWPECHEPQWVRGMSETERQHAILTMLSVVVARYRAHPALAMWQLENEPFLDFGRCPPSDARFFVREMDLVRALDHDHQIVVTDSGELNWWLVASRYGDVVGTTVYRTVFSGRTQRSLFL